jgi:hypothetical protein
MEASKDLREEEPQGNVKEGISWHLFHFPDRWLV